MPSKARTSSPPATTGDAIAPSRSTSTADGVPTEPSSRLSDPSTSSTTCAPKHSDGTSSDPDLTSTRFGARRGRSIAQCSRSLTIAEQCGHVGLQNSSANPAPQTSSRLLTSRPSGPIARNSGTAAPIAWDDDALFLMLAHSAISKHVSTSGMGLHRVADIALWWQRREVRWPTVRQRLNESGLQAAAWTVLTWVDMLSPDAFRPMLAAPIDSLRPGRLRASYLRAWLDHDLSARLTRHHAGRLLGFSMFLHDRPSDGWRAFRGRRRSQTSQQHDAEVFEGL